MIEYYCQRRIPDLRDINPVIISIIQEEEKRKRDEIRRDDLNRPYLPPLPSSEISRLPQERGKEPKEGEDSNPDKYKETFSF